MQKSFYFCNAKTSLGLFPRPHPCLGPTPLRRSVASRSDRRFEGKQRYEPLAK